MARRRPKKETPPAKAGAALKQMIVSGELSLSEALAAARILPGEHPNDGKSERFSSQVDDRGDSWDSGLDYPAMLLASRDGLEPSRKFNLNTSRFQNERDITGVTYHHDVAGDEVDIGVYLSGEVECFLDPRLVTKLGQSPVVEILVSVCAAFHVEASVIERRGAAIFALCETLEKSGKAVGITICSPIGALEGAKGDLLDIRIRVKEPFEHTNTRRLYYFLTHPTVLRRIYFRLWEQQPKPVRERFGIHRNYGLCIDVPEFRQPEHCIYVPTIPATDKTFTANPSAQAWVTGLLEAQGATIG